MNSIHPPRFRFFRMLSAIVLGGAGSTLSVRAASEASTSPAPPAYTAEQKAALVALDGAVARYEALVVRDDDAQHQAAAKIVLEEFKQRRAAIRQAYDQSRYDELRVDLNLEYQRLASWEAAPTTLPPAAKAAPAPAPAIYQLNPSPSNPAEVKAALEAADAEITRLDARSDALPAGPARDAAKLRLKAIKERRSELGKDFTKTRWDALLADLKAQREG